MAVNKNNVKIHVEHLKKNFGNLEVLRDVSTDIYEGEVVVVLGPRAAASPPSCAALTGWRRSPAARSSWTATT